jgi:indolepyruvate ferredoxin oxidoreductase beta subunit
MAKNTVTNILITGVGGQGILLASKVLSKAALNEGYDVKQAEVHGMSQRGGSVNASVRFGEKVHSPLIKAGETDFLLAFELLEAYREIEQLKKNGHVIVNTQKIDPISVSSGKAKYPNNLEDLIKKERKNSTFLDALGIALKLKEVRAVNVVMIGALSNLVNLKEDSLLSAIESSVPSKALDVNLKAFAEGKKLT